MTISRKATTLRLSPEGHASVEKIAERERRSKSETLRLLVAYGALHMPKGWTGR
jgi:hypothetical protein